MIQWLSRDWGMKLLALVLAIGLWYYAVGEEDVEFKRTVPLEIELKNEQMSILRTSVKTLQVTLAASRGLLSELASEKIRAVHIVAEDVSSAGDYSFRIEPREINLPSAQVRVIKIEPEVIQVTLDELIAKKLKVRPSFSGEPAFGYTVKEEEIQIDPNAIMIEGPKDQLEQQEFVETEGIDLVGRIRSFRRTVRLNLPSNVKALSETIIDVFIPIKEEFTERSYDEVLVKLLRTSVSERQTVQVQPPTISFTLKGSKRQLENLTPEKLLAYVDASTLGLGDHEAEVELVLPEDVSLKEGSSVLVKVIITKL